MLVTVLGALALIAFMAGRFAERVDSLRQQTASLREAANARIEASSVKAAALFWVTTKPQNANGYGDGLQAHWQADGRWYRMGKEALVSLQDQRGLLSVNVMDRESLARLLLEEGVDAAKLSTLLDVVEDYTDMDDLKHLNGAEVAQYREVGLLAPRNDWMLSVLELRQLPAWRDHPALCEKLSRLLTTRRSEWLNPNTSPRSVLKAIFPTASAEQVDNFVALRRSAPFVDGLLASKATGLLADSEAFIFHVGNEVRLSVWVPGLHRVHEYNLTLTPGGRIGPWSIQEFHTVSPQLTGLATEQVVDFPDPAFPSPAPKR